jgi:hypothetical protein
MLVSRGFEIVSMIELRRVPDEERLGVPRKGVASERQVFHSTIVHLGARSERA